MEYLGFIAGLNLGGEFFSECEIFEEDFSLDIAVGLFLREKAAQYQIAENMPVVFSLEKLKQSEITTREIKLNPDSSIIFGGESFVAGFGIDLLPNMAYISLFVVDKWHFMGHLLVKYCSEEDLPILLDTMYDSNQGEIESCQEICDKIIEKESSQCGFCSVLIYYKSQIYRGEKDEKGL